jgi:hypothetical protein
MTCSRVKVTFYVFDLVQTGPEVYPSSCTMGTGFYARSMALNTHHFPARG